MTESAVEVHELTRTFGEFVAVIVSDWQQPKKEDLASFIHIVQDDFRRLAPHRGHGWDKKQVVGFVTNGELTALKVTSFQLILAEDITRSAGVTAGWL